jgi:hypothetical protein
MRLASKQIIGATGFVGVRAGETSAPPITLRERVIQQRFFRFRQTRRIERTRGP